MLKGPQDTLLPSSYLHWGMDFNQVFQHSSAAAMCPQSPGSSEGGDGVASTQIAAEEQFYTICTRALQSEVLTRLGAKGTSRSGRSTLALATTPTANSRLQGISFE